LRGIEYKRQVAIDVEFKGKLLSGQRLDLIVDNYVVVELKSSKNPPAAASAQTLSYLRATGP